MPQVLLLQRGQRAVFLQRGQRLVDAGHQRVALGEQQPVVLPAGRELADHHRVLDLRRRDVLGRRRVGDQRRDLVRLQRLLHVVQRLVHLGRLGRLDRAVDEGQAGRADLVAEHVALQLGRGVLGHDRGALQRDQRLLHVVVAGRERDRRGPLRRDRDLVDVEVELLRARRVGVVERLVSPLDLGVLEAELLGHGVRHGALVALAVGRVVAGEPRRVGGLVGGHGEHTLGVQVLLHPGVRATGRGRAGRGAAAARLPPDPGCHTRPARYPAPRARR